MSEWFQPLEFPFMRDALWVGMMVAATCAMLSCFLVLRGWSLMGDAVSHAVLPGIVVAYGVGLPLAVGAFVAGLFCSTATGFIQRNSRVKKDTVMGVVFTGMFALGLVMFSRMESDLHLDHILLGNILGISRSQAMQTLILGAVLLLVTWVKRRDLLLVSFDRGQAKVLALPERLLDYLLLSLLSLAIVVSLQAVGLILVVAMLVTPGSVGLLWTDRFDRMLLIAVGSAVASTASGILISYHLDASTGGCIVLVQALVFCASLAFAPKYGWLGRRMNRRKGKENPV